MIIFFCHFEKNISMVFWFILLLLRSLFQLNWYFFLGIVLFCLIAFKITCGNSLDYYKLAWCKFTFVYSAWNFSFFKFFRLSYPLSLWIFFSQFYLLSFSENLIRPLLESSFCINQGSAESQNHPSVIWKIAFISSSSLLQITSVLKN